MVQWTKILCSKEFRSHLFLIAILSVFLDAQGFGSQGLLGQVPTCRTTWGACGKAHKGLHMPFLMRHTIEVFIKGNVQLVPLTDNTRL